MSWWGEVGVKACDDAGSFHYNARAMDLTKVWFSDGSFCDMAWSWDQGQRQKRRYVGVAASLRKYFGNVLTRWYNADHRDHIHFDNGIEVPPIRDNVKTDTTLVQASCNFFNGESLVIDGAWGSATEAAFDRLRSALGMGCYDIRGNVSHTKVFLTQIVKCGMADVSANGIPNAC